MRHRSGLFALSAVLAGVLVLSGAAIAVSVPMDPNAVRVAVEPAPQRLTVSPAAQLRSLSVDSYAVEAAPPPIASQVAGLGEVRIPFTMNVAWPVVDPTRISDGFGPREAPCGGCSTFHKGVDYVPGDGTPVMAIADGIVTAATDEGGGLGTMVEIQHHVDGQLLTSTYGHLQHGSPAQHHITPGDHIVAGQPIGLVGTTGQSTGPHLHLELYPTTGERIDPHAWLTTHLNT